MRYRKKRPLKRKTGQLRDTRLIIVATEGTKSEPAYLRGFHNPRVQIWILETEEGKSSPDHVMERIDAFRNEHEFYEDDEFWLMIDVDRWGPKKLATIARLASQRKYQLAVSNPCFELWLLLHFEPATSARTCRELAGRLRTKLGSYNKSKLDFHEYSDFVIDAVRRAETLDTTPGIRWPANPGTRVYRVVNLLV